jgi:magnesium transporter
MPTSKDLKELLERIHLRLDESFVGIGSEVADLPAADLAELLNQLTLVEAATVISMLPLARCIELCDQPTMRRRAAIFEQLDPSRVAAILEGLSADERTDIIQKMGLHERHRVLPKFSPEMRTELEDLLQYPDHTAGGIMTTEFVRLDPAMTVGDALKHIRVVAREKESIYACYVMERETDQLLGAVSLRDLVMAELERPLSQVMRRKPVTVNVHDDQEAVAQKIGKYNLLAVPVLETDGSLVGFVTVDDVIDVLIEEQTEDLLRMAAVNPGAMDKPYFDNPIFRVVRKRIGWLLLLFVAGTLTSAVLHRFENELAAVVALAFFIPLLIGTGGNAGAQTVMTVIRSLALGEVGVRHARRVVVREATTGMLLGLMVAPIAFGQALLWKAPMELALTVSVTMFAICVWSTTVGALIPILAQRFGVDPAVLSAPLITTLVDATGLVIYFTIAKVILGV